jgi:hypothetical protein
VPPFRYVVPANDISVGAAVVVSVVIFSTVLANEPSAFWDWLVDTSNW